MVFSSGVPQNKAPFTHPKYYWHIDIGSITANHVFLCIYISNLAKKYMSALAYFGTKFQAASRQEAVTKGGGNWSICARHWILLLIQHTCHFIHNVNNFNWYRFIGVLTPKFICSIDKFEVKITCLWSYPQNGQYDSKPAFKSALNCVFAPL